MKVLVTGANGFLGVGIVKALLKYGHNVTATDLNIDKIDKAANKVACNLFDIENPFEYFGSPDVVLHLAWRNGFVHNADSHMSDLYNHHKFLLNLFQADVKRIAVLGSMHEVGFYEGSVDEHTVCNPMSLYGIAKNALRNDVVLMARTYKKQYQWLRGFYIVSNSCNGSSIFSKIVQAEKNNIKIFPFTMGTNQFDFLEYDYFCEYVARAVEQDVYDGIINICSGYPEKLSERVERFIKENNYNIRLQYGIYPDRPYDSKAIWGDNTKINAIMQLKSL